MSPALALLAAAAYVAMHLGKLHAWEQALVYSLAFGPFIVLGIVVHVVRRRDLADEDEERG
jgi:hypothetical protein